MANCAAVEEENRRNAYLHYIAQYERLSKSGSSRDAIHQKRVADHILPGAPRRHLDDIDLTPLYKRHVDDSFLKREETHGTTNSLGSAKFSVDLSQVLVPKETEVEIDFEADEEIRSLIGSLDFGTLEPGPAYAQLVPEKVRNKPNAVLRTSHTPQEPAISDDICQAGKRRKPGDVQGSCSNPEKRTRTGFVTGRQFYQKQKSRKLHQVPLELAGNVAESAGSNSSTVETVPVSAPPAPAPQPSLPRRKQKAFIPPTIKNMEGGKPDNSGTPPNPDKGDLPESLKKFDRHIVDTILSEIMERHPKVTWDDIAGLRHAKRNIREMVVLPLKRPDIFTGLRSPPKGVLLFGPPGTGKTLIAKCVAAQACATFFSISASSLTSKWVGEGEKMVRVMFEVARLHQPAVVFMDELDALLGQRGSDDEREGSRRLKTEFLVQFDGVGTDDSEKVIILGATNRPQEIDEAARRRFRKRLYIPLPDLEGRVQIIKNLMKDEADLTDEDIRMIGEKTEGYSGSDVDGLCREAAFEPVREAMDAKAVGDGDIESIGNVRKINVEDMRKALTQVRASVSKDDLLALEKWNDLFGSKSTA